MTESTGSEPHTRNWLAAARAVLSRARNVVRRLDGACAHERYLAHWQDHHAGDGGAPLDRAAFFRAEQARKWNGVRRCC